MKIEHQVCTEKQGLRLIELGITAESHFAYCLYSRDGNPDSDPITIVIDNEHKLANQVTYIAPAFTVSELGVMLPDCKEITGLGVTEKDELYVSYKLNPSFLKGCDADLSRKWVCEEVDNMSPKYSYYTEAEARAAALIYLVENNLITASDCNYRLNA